MRQMKVHRFGAEDVLDEVEIPSPEPRQMVIRIAATSINHSDLFIRQNGNIHIGPSDLPLRPSSRPAPRFKPLFHRIFCGE